jgi:hypothetical protein
MIRVNARGGYGPNLLPGVGDWLTGGQFDLCICAACGFVRTFVPENLLPDVREKYAALPIMEPPH